MKKSAFYMILLAVLFAVLTGCTTADKPSEVPADPTLHSTIYEAQAPEFSFTHIYGNPESQSTWLWVDCDISNAAIVCINYDEETFAPSLGDVFYSFGDIAQGEGILLYMEMPEGFPTHAITYTVGDEEYTYAMGYSGIDGSTTLTDFEELK